MDIHDHTHKAKFCPVSLGVAIGLVWGIIVLLIGLLAFYFEYGKLFVGSMGQLYIGYEPSIIGSLIGGLIGFLEAFIAGFFIGVFYNCFTRCCHKHDEKLPRKKK